MIHTSGIVGLIVIIAICGVLLYLLNALVPMDPKFKTAINAIAGLVLFLFVVRALFGLPF